MTLDEAIQHCKEKAKELSDKAYQEWGVSVTEEEAYDCNECAREHEQLAKWLEDYKRLLGERPHGKYEFLEIFAQYVPDDICTYPENRGKPYYSIHFRENGEDFVGFGTYKIEVLSRYLQDYFFCPKCGAKMEADDD